MATYPPALVNLPEIFNPDEFYQEQTGDVGTLAEVLAEGNNGNNLGIVSGGAIGCSSITTPFGFINALETTTITDIATTGVAIDPTGTLKIKGATTKGSLLAGDGTNTIDLPTSTNGLYLKTNSATASGLEWVEGINTIQAGNNISVNNSPTTNPTISVREPLNATLQLGEQQISGSSVVGDDNATLSIQSQNGITSSVVVEFDNNTTGTSNTGSLTANDLQSQILLSTLTTGGTATHTITSGSGGLDETKNIISGSNISNYQEQRGTTQNVISANITDSSTYNNQLQEILNSSGNSRTYAYQNIGATKVVLQNIQATSSQALSTQSYSDVGGLQTFTQNEANSTYGRVRTTFIPSTGGVNVLTTMTSNNGGNSLFQQYGGNSTEMTTTNTQSNYTTSLPLQLISAVSILSTTAGENNMYAGTTTKFTTANNGSVAIPSFRFINNSANTINYPAITIERAIPNSTAGNIIGAISYQAKDATGSQIEWVRMQTKTENVGAGNQDATLSIFNSVNGVVSETFNFNGGQNENNSFRPLDMNGNDIRTITGGLQIGCSTSATAGAVLTLATKDATAGSGAGLSLTGNTLLNASAGGSSGQHLCITINGVVYKIALLNA